MDLTTTEPRLRRDVSHLGWLYMALLRGAMRSDPAMAARVYRMPARARIGYRLERATRQGVEAALAACPVPYGPTPEDYPVCMRALSNAKAVYDGPRQFVTAGDDAIPEWLEALGRWEEQYWRVVSRTVEEMGVVTAGTIFAFSNRDLLSALGRADIAALDRLAGTMTACHIRSTVAYDYMSACVALDNDASERVILSGLLDSTN